MSYKYREIPEGENVFFLQIVKPLKWSDSRESDCIPNIPIGSITWVAARCKDALFTVENGIMKFKNPDNVYHYHSVQIENNRYMCNFCPSCFEILHTSKQKIRR